MTDERLQELATRGFVVLRGFIAKERLRVFADDFEVAPRPFYSMRAADPVLVDELSPDILALAERVRACTPLRSDVAMNAFYFSTQAGVDFPWHQDYEAYFLLQDHYHYLNFYMPVVKPDAATGNVSVIPFDVLKERDRALHDKALGGGARWLVTERGCTRVLHHSMGEEEALDWDIGELAVTPELEVGDLFLLRGDVIHRTQPAKCDRLALSIRLADGQTPIRRADLMRLAPAMKAKMFSEGLMRFIRLTALELLERSGREELPFVELQQHLRHSARRRSP
jgi:hypothetical protein